MMAGRAERGAGAPERRRGVRGSCSKRSSRRWRSSRRTAAQREALEAQRSDATGGGGCGGECERMREELKADRRAGAHLSTIVRDGMRQGESADALTAAPSVATSRRGGGGRDALPAKNRAAEEEPARCRAIESRGGGGGRPNGRRLQQERRIAPAPRRFRDVCSRRDGARPPRSRRCRRVRAPPYPRDGRGGSRGGGGGGSFREPVARRARIIRRRLRIEVDDGRRRVHRDGLQRIRRGGGDDAHRRGKRPRAESRSRFWGCFRRPLGPPRASRGVGSRRRDGRLHGARGPPPTSPPPDPSSQTRNDAVASASASRAITARRGPSQTIELRKEVVAAAPRVPPPTRPACS